MNGCGWVLRKDQIVRMIKRSTLVIWIVSAILKLTNHILWSCHKAGALKPGLQSSVKIRLSFNSSERFLNAYRNHPTHLSLAWLFARITHTNPTPLVLLPKGRTVNITTLSQPQLHLSTYQLPYTQLSFSSLLIFSFFCPTASCELIAA